MCTLARHARILFHGWSRVCPDSLRPARPRRAPSSPSAWSSRPAAGRVGALPAGLPARASPLALQTAEAHPCSAELLGEGDPKNRENPGWVAAAPETVGSWWPRGQGPGWRPCLLLCISLARESHCRLFPGPLILSGVLRPLYTVPLSGVEIAELKSPLFPGNGTELTTNWILLLSTSQG